MASHELPSQVPPFSMVIRLSDITLDCGALTLAAFRGAPGGEFGKVLFGQYRGIRVAVKIMLSPQVDVAAFMKEVGNMVAVRSAVGRMRVLERFGAPLSEPCDLPDVTRRCTTAHDLRGHKHVVFVYGVGTEPDLAAVAPELPTGPAYLIVMEELTGGTLASAPPTGIAALLRVSAELADGLVFLVAAHVVHADLKVSFRCSERDCGGIQV